MYLGTVEVHVYDGVFLVGRAERKPIVDLRGTEEVRDRERLKRLLLERAQSESPKPDPAPGGQT